MLTIISYLEFVSALGKEQSIFALDDGMLMSGKEFKFGSIEEVAECCFTHALSVARAHGRCVPGQPQRREIALGGWSYGGVVAAELAKLIRKKQLEEDKGSDTTTIDIDVQAVILFDSPVRQPNKLHEANSDDSQAYRNLTNGAAAPDASGGGEVNEVVVRTAKHFSACTELLKKHHSRPAEQRTLLCPVFDIRPEESDYLCDISAIEELSSSAVTRTMVLGSHWTMLFGEFVTTVARLVKEILAKKKTSDNDK